MKFFLCAHQAKKKLEHCAILPVQLIMNGLDLIVMKNASQAGVMMDHFVGLQVSLTIIKRWAAHITPIAKALIFVFYHLCFFIRI